MQTDKQKHDKKTESHSFSETVWIYPSETAAWHFITLPKELAHELRAAHQDKRRGFGSLRVRVTIGETSWETSIFPDKREDSYLLPIKATVRKTEGIFAGDRVKLRLEVL